MLQVNAIDDLPPEELAKRFNEARSHDYQELIRILGQMQRRKLAIGPQLERVRRRLQEITTIDFFVCGLRKRAEELLLSLTEGNRETKKQVVS